VAEAYDWLGLAEAKIVLSKKASDTSDDISIAHAISAVSRRLDVAVGPAVVRSVTDEIHSGAGFSIELRHTPVVSFTSVVEYQGTTVQTLGKNAPGTLPFNGYHAKRYTPQPELELYSGLVYRTLSGQRAQWWPQAENIVVSYVAGRYVDTTSVDPRFKEAAKVTLKNWWKMYERSVSSAKVGEFIQPAQSFPTYALPNAVVRMLSDVWKLETGFGA